MATRNERSKGGSGNSKVSDLRRMINERGRDAGGSIANQVIDRIVSNSTAEFQDFLSRAGQGSASANATSAINTTPQPVPYGTPAQATSGMPVQPPPFGSASGLMGGAMPDPMAMAVPPVPFAEPPALMPDMRMPPMPSSSPVLPQAPTLSPNRPSPVDPRMEALLRNFGLI